MYLHQEFSILQHEKFAIKEEKDPDKKWTCFSCLSPALEDSNSIMINAEYLDDVSKKNKEPSDCSSAQQEKPQEDSDAINRKSLDYVSKLDKEPCCGMLSCLSSAQRDKPQEDIIATNRKCLDDDSKRNANNSDQPTCCGAILQCFSYFSLP